MALKYSLLPFLTTVSLVYSPPPTIKYHSEKHEGCFMVSVLAQVLLFWFLGFFFKSQLIFPVLHFNFFSATVSCRFAEIFTLALCDPSYEVFDPLFGF